MVDIVIYNALGWLARDAMDIAWLGKKFAYHRVSLHTVSVGQVDDQIRVRGLAPRDISKAFNRQDGSRHRFSVLAGHLVGGRAYTLRSVVRLDDRGEPVRVLLEIYETQAAIFERCAAGRFLRPDRYPSQIPTTCPVKAATTGMLQLRGALKKANTIINNSVYVSQLV